ncbi:hypothetical protein Glove_242g199 [Diversispora epigaea]|uniref:Uncharacterized protein n=1 Tax=Diversispora epigaea TaxID=1348612 RepID=A0A397IDW6_9GLOM|nr:hypothetical protein Glove_242g199 [Diversispora epigaea]
MDKYQFWSNFVTHSSLYFILSFPTGVFTSEISGQPDSSETPTQTNLSATPSETGASNETDSIFLGSLLAFKIFTFITSIFVSIFIYTLPYTLLYYVFKRQDANLDNLENQDNLNDPVDSNDVKVDTTGFTFSRCFKLKLAWLVLSVLRFIFIAFFFINEFSRYLQYGPLVALSLHPQSFIITAVLFCVMIIYELFMLRHVIFIATQAKFCSKFFGVSNSKIYFGLRSLFHLLALVIFFRYSHNEKQRWISLVSFIVNKIVFIGHLYLKRDDVRGYFEYLSYILQLISWIFLPDNEEKFSNTMAYISSGILFAITLGFTCLLFDYSRPKYF